MADDDLEPISGSAPASPNPRVEYRPAQTRERDAGGQDQSRREARFSELASQLDIPDHMLTPKVQRALTSIVDEIEGLRYRLEQAQRRQAYLERIADEDSNLPILNRRAFLREMGGMIESLARTESPGTMVFLYLEAYEDIRREHGLTVAERALKHLAVAVRDSLRQTDLVGHVGGAGVCVALALAGEGGGVTKAWEMVQKVKRMTFVHEGEMLPLTLSVGVHEFGHGDTPEAVLRAADRNRQARTGHEAAFRRS